MRRRSFASALAASALAAAAFVAGSAHGAGLSRPNIVGARAIGMGGAYTAVADDPTAVWYNPAGTAVYGDNVGYIGGELLFTQREYQPGPGSPLANNGVTGTVHENTSPTLLPVLGFTTRFGLGKNAPTRFAFSIAAYDAYGGNISFSPSRLVTASKPGGLVGTSNVQILNYELAPTLAYQVNEILSLGAALRIGINELTFDNADALANSKLNGSGVGIGGTLGAFIRPIKLLQVGLTYHTPMSVTINGVSPIIPVGQMADAMNTHTAWSGKINWPQSVSAGVAVQAHPRLLVSVQADWTGWSSVEQIKLTATSGGESKAMSYMDSYAVHLGFQGVVTRWLVLRFGAAFDSNAIPDSTERRENEDTNKITMAGGFGLHFWKLFIDGAFEGFLPLGWRDVNVQTANNENGKYGGNVYSAELSAQIRF